MARIRLQNTESSTKKKCMTLSRLEADKVALANPGVPRPVVLELQHPWLPRPPCLNSSKLNYRVLKETVEKFEKHLVPTTSYCNEKWNRVCNKIRTKSNLDTRFYTAWHLPIQDAYVLCESRENRSVVSLDINSMYASCMQYLFPDPSNLRFIKLDRLFNSSEKLPFGLYRCILRDPNSEFIKKHNPFRSFFGGIYLKTKLNRPILIDLNEFEVYYYANHFSEIHLIDAVISDQTIPHPLAREAKRSFARRKHYLSNSNKSLSDQEKFFLTLMSSCTHRPSKHTYSCTSVEAVEYQLDSSYGIHREDGEPYVAFEDWLDGRKGVHLYSSKAGLEISGPNISDGSACFVFNQRIVARSRISILEEMEKIDRLAPEVEICYVNIDSVHFSLPTEYLSQTLNSLHEKASREMGSYKIECTSNHGLWLEPGRYWLYSNTLIKHKNRSIRNTADPFKNVATYVVNKKIGDFHIPVVINIQMDHSMSPTRKIFNNSTPDFLRQHLIEVDSSTKFENILEQLEKGKLVAVPKKMQHFYELKEFLKTP